MAVNSTNHNYRRIITPGLYQIYQGLYLVESIRSFSGQNVFPARPFPISSGDDIITDTGFQNHTVANQATHKQFIRSLQTDNLGNIYYCGVNRLVNSAVHNIRKHDSSGALLWSVNWAPAAENVGPYCLCVDNNYNVYVVGRDTDNNIRKYNSSGVLQWQTHFTTPGTSNTIGEDRAAVDASGNLYIAGSLADGGRIRKYDTDGNILWTVLSAPGTGNLSVTLDTSGNVYTCGPITDDGFTHSKYDTNGVVLWQILTTETVGNFKVVVDLQGDLFFLSSTVDKYDTNGNFITSFSTGAIRYGFVDADNYLYLIANVALGVDNLYKMGQAGDILWGQRLKDFGFTPHYTYGVAVYPPQLPQWI